MLYTYRCPACFELFDRQFPFTENPEEVPCIRCGAVAWRSFVSVPPIQFKGTGWSGERHGVHQRQPETEAEAGLAAEFDDRRYE